MRAAVTVVRARRRLDLARDEAGSTTE
jgi:hypothetical protein